jgi:hypothetical protein
MREKAAFSSLTELHRSPISVQCMNIVRSLILAAVMFAAGVFFGRRFPAHRYQQFGTGSLLIDGSTGVVCAANRYSPDRWKRSDITAPPPGFEPLDPNDDSAYPPCGQTQ